MRRLVLCLSVAVWPLAVAAQTACYAEYKAKRGDPLRLHYGIVALDAQECRAPEAAVARRIKVEGWELLTVMGLLDARQAEGRRADAGAYFLRY